MSKRKIESPEYLEKMFNEYLEQCKNNTIKRTEFSQRLGEYFTKDIPKPTAPTIEGFAVYLGISSASLYSTYFTDNPEYSEIVTRVRDTVQIAQMDLLVTGQAPPQLAGLLLSRYGYKLPAQAQDDTGIAEAINKRDEVLNKITIGTAENTVNSEQTADNDN